MSYSKKDAPTRFYFDSEALPERDRFGAMCEEVMRRYGGIDVVKRDDAPLRASSDVRRVGALRIAEIASRPLELVRTPELMRDGDDALCVTLTRSGVACMTQCGDEQRAYAGGGMIFDYGRVGHFFLDYGHAGKVFGTEGSRYCNLKIERSRILTLVPRLTQPAGALLDKDPVALRLLFGYLARTIDIDLQEGGRAARLYEDHIVDLVALSLGAARDQQVQIEERSMRAVRRDAILREIEMHMDDPNLSAAAVGAKLGVTARYVHLLLEETGRSFNQHVLGRRLERAAKLLRDPRHHHRRIGDIAFELGFIDLSHFNRAFRRRFGDTPSGVRAFNRVAGEVAEFLTGARHQIETDRVLATVMFTDIVDSTRRAVELGDRRWRALVDRHDDIVREHLARFRGREVRGLGDGFLVTFDGPARGVRCATAIAEAVHTLGLDVRAGLHTGEIELNGGDIGGISVNIAARVAAMAEAGQTLVSRTVRDLVAGSGLRFEDRGRHRLKGLSEEIQLYAALASG